MKKIFLTLLLAAMLLYGCQKQEYHENGVPTYFLEPEGYVIAVVDVEDNYILANKRLYGYITEEDYNAWLSGTLNDVLIVKHPYENGKEVSAPISEIKTIEIGIYKDLRYQN